MKTPQRSYVTGTLPQRSKDVNAPTLLPLYIGQDDGGTLKDADHAPAPAAIFLPGAADELRERVAAQILHLQVQRALRDTLRTTGHTQDLRTRCGHLGALPARGFLAGGGSEHRAG
jgi:hypothetical protein